MTIRLSFLLVSVLLLTSCIKDEAPNAEADITECIVDNSILKRDPIIQNDKVTLLVKGNPDLSRQAPEFTLTAGATIEPESGTMRNFTTPQTYTVTSEDRQWKKTYTVSFIVDEISTIFHFEDTIVGTSKKYYIFAEKLNGAVTMEWASGNAGFSLTGAASTPDDFPTTQYNDGYIGKCACLTTRSTGSFGATFGMPLAAGNLFIGTFNVGSALSNALKATQFGLPFYNIPVSFSGHYKYKAGDSYYENGSIIENKKDKCHFYAVLYETDDVTKTLDGTNVLTHPNIISAAVIGNQTESDEWIRFDIPFVYRDGKSIDREKLKNGKYNLAVVFTSSIDGARFKGATGSRLLIDEVEITLEADE
ncbi:MAG: PCMD domain-containing protein [Tannerella sp.]|jgi:hypothetical protein|nr:PCMD domain-containing protein [Tannerella sp.]